MTSPACTPRQDTPMLTPTQGETTNYRRWNHWASTMCLSCKHHPVCAHHRFLIETIRSPGYDTDCPPPRRR